MPFMPAWKTAKTAFETETNKKKPSEKFLGVFRKGTGIEDSLKKLDSAKKGEDIKKALASFKSSYTSYIALLDTTSKDPKSVKPEDKPAYTTAIGKLKNALQKIEADAERIASASSDVGDKEKTSADAQLQKSLVADANKHIALREQVLKDVTALNVQIKAAVADLNNRVALVEKQKQAAKDAGKSGNMMMHQVAVGVIDRHIDEAEAIATKNAALVRDFTKEGSPMMKARADKKEVFDSITGPAGADLKAKRDKPWSAVSAAAAEQNTFVAQMKAAVEKMKAAKASAEAAGSQMKDPKEYIASITKIKSEMDGVFKAIRVKSDRVVKSLAQFDDKVKQMKGDKAAIQKHCKLEEDQWKRYGPETSAARDRILSMKKQVAKLPPGAFEDPGVQSASDRASKFADECAKTLDNDLKDGAALQLKINQAKQTYK
ncbi:MAG: hypothetical protein HBSAPP03_09390 [Phycisphaerae bacterium]|nr:MAG: hypothetical protein HBSAPP03_09390 [Phycisphaerae bacterium]